MAGNSPHFSSLKSMGPLIFCPIFDIPYDHEIFAGLAAAAAVGTAEATTGVNCVPAIGCFLGDGVADEFGLAVGLDVLDHVDGVGGEIWQQKAGGEDLVRGLV